VTKQKFREEVYRAGPTLPKDALDWAIQYQVDIGCMDKQHVRNCVQLAERYRESQPKEKDVSNVIVPSSVVESDQLVERITPWIEDTRQEVFGNSSQPFKSKRQAETWLRDEEKVQYGGRAATGLLELGGTVVRAWPDGTLMTLAEQQKEIEKWTGFSEEAALAFILCGIKPLRPHYRVTPELVIGKLIRRKVTIEVNEVLNREDLAAIQKKVRKWLYKKTDLYSPGDWLVMQAVTKLGGEPATGKVDFWEKVEKECNRQRPGTYENWEGPRKRYRRMQPKPPGRKAAKKGEAGHGGTR
jgi:hypothetical protein